MRSRDDRMEDAIIELGGIVELLDSIAGQIHTNLSAYHRIAGKNDWPVVNLNVPTEGLAWLSGRLETTLLDLKNAFYGDGLYPAPKPPLSVVPKDDEPAA